MQIFAQMIFWGSILALGHTYVLYPLWMRWLARNKGPNPDRYAADDAGLPTVYVLMSLYNEEKVIVQKLESLYAQRYPADKLKWYVGSDCSSDRTAELVAGFQRTYAPEHFHFHDFRTRQGKPPVINALARLALEDWAASGQTGGAVFLLTDASVMLEPETLYRLVRHFRNPKIGVVDAHMRSAGLRSEGISQSEDQYLNGEVRLKHWESLAWGMMIGPFGGCYALRAELFEPVPPHSLVDDFWLVFRVLEKGFMAINDLEAVCHEGATHEVADEYRRKKRIAAGSFQNLARFKSWVLPPVSRLGFAFFSHKVLRWFGGFFLLAAYLSLAGLALGNHFYRWLFCLLTMGVATVLVLNYVQNRLPLRPLRLIKHLNYFLVMNLALTDGFFKWLRGIRENTWQRTQRY
ncbi:MAG: glycosyltransferase [Saprospiraceae bacterium]|nr:glycosyltransferase [Saprospiraceae bacterium]